MKKKKAYDILQEFATLSWGAFIGIVGFIFFVSETSNSSSMIFVPLFCLILAGIFTFFKVIVGKPDNKS